MEGFEIIALIKGKISGKKYFLDVADKRAKETIKATEIEIKELETLLRQIEK